MSLLIDAVDEINTCLIQTKAVLALITTSGENLKEGFTVNHSQVVEALWCVTTLIEKAEEVVNAPQPLDGSANQ